MSYVLLIKTAYRITRRHPFLWIFGLFMVGSFNLTFLHFFDVSVDAVQESSKIFSLLDYFQQRPGQLALLSLLVLAASILGLLVTNWSRIMLVQKVVDILENRHTNWAQLFANSRRALRPVIQISLFTSFLILAVSAALFVPPLLLVRNPAFVSALLAFGVVLFLPLAFTVTCLNIFSSFFVIIFRVDFRKALHLATDLFVSKWPEVLGLSVILMVIYSAVYFLGVAVVSLLNFLAAASTNSLEMFGLPQFSAMIILPQGAIGILLWFLFAALSVFINTSLILLFLELMRPAKKETKEQPAAMPA